MEVGGSRSGTRSRGALGGLVDAELGEQAGAQGDEAAVAPRARGLGTSTGTSSEIDAVGEHQHPVGEQDGLVDVVGDEQDRRVVPGAQLAGRGRACGCG